MRTTVRLDDALLRDAKRLAAEEGRTLTSVIEDGLRELLAHRTAETSEPRPLTTVAGGTAPGVTWEDLMDNSRTAELLGGWP